MPQAAAFRASGHLPHMSSAFLSQALMPFIRAAMRGRCASRSAAQASTFCPWIDGEKTQPRAASSVVRG